MVYGNKSRSSIIFFEELEGLKNKYLQRFNLINVLAGKERMLRSILDESISEKLNELSKLIDYASIDEVFICGPEEMIFCVKDFLEQKELIKRRFILNCLPLREKRQSDSQRTEVGSIDSGPGKSKITVKLDGQKF